MTNTLEHYVSMDSPQLTAVRALERARVSAGVVDALEAARACRAVCEASRGHPRARGWERLSHRWAALALQRAS